MSTHPTLPVTPHHSPITPHLSPLTNFSFISDNLELNAAVSRYFKYVRSETIATTTLPLTPHPSPLYQSTPHPTTLLIQNEIFTEQNLLGIYPLWFHWGIKQNRKVFCLTMSETDTANNIFNWQDFLEPGAFDHFHRKIDYRKVPYFEETAGMLHSILKPHGGDSLYDITANLHTTFADLPRKFRKTELTPTALQTIKADFLDKGINHFSQFQQKETRHHHFLSYLPDSPTLFAAISRLETFIDQLKQIDFNTKRIRDILPMLLEQIKTEVIYLYRFFEDLEAILQGGSS